MVPVAASAVAAPVAASADPAAGGMAAAATTPAPRATKPLRLIGVMRPPLLFVCPCGTSSARVQSAVAMVHSRTGRDP